jgi:hypothetical protein
MDCVDGSLAIGGRGAYVYVCGLFFYIIVFHNNFFLEFSRIVSGSSRKALMNEKMEHRG